MNCKRQTIPLVSILMPVYNGEKYVREAVLSILNQTYRRIELLIVNDASTDQTEQIINCFRDDRIVLIHNQENQGVARSLNHALRRAKGDYVARMDSDDIAYPNRLEKQVRFLEKNRDISFCGAWGNQIGEKRGIIKFPCDHEEILTQHLFNPAFIHPVVCWRRDVFESHELTYQEYPPTAEDYDLWVRASRHVKMANLSIPLIHYRVDQTIKISDYLKQQYAGARQIRFSLLEDWVDFSEEEWTLLHQIAEASFSPNLDFLRNAGLLLKKMVQLNAQFKHFDDQALQKTTSIYWYRLLVAHLYLKHDEWIEIKKIIRTLSLSISLRHHISIFIKRFMFSCRSNLKL